MAIVLKLARQGYGGGDPMKIFQMPSDVVMAAIQYEQFLSDYESTYYEINKDA